MIEFRGLVKAFGGKAVLTGVDLAVARGERMYIIGTSGVGKSVTIKHVVGLMRPDGGEAFYGEAPDSAPRGAIALVHGLAFVSRDTLGRSPETTSQESCRLPSHAANRFPVGVKLTALERAR